MAIYNSLKATVNANIKANNNQEITGPILNSVLTQMINSLGAGYQYMGVATPTNPGSAQTPDYKCFYLATTPGTYSHLGGLVVADGEVAILKYDTSWTKKVTGIASADKLNHLRGELISVAGAKYTFESRSYKRIPFNAVLPIGTKIDKTLYPYALYLVDTDNNTILVGNSINIHTTTAEIIAFMPTTNDSGTICVVGKLDGYDEQISKINKQIINGLGVDVSFVNKAYSIIPFDLPLPVGTIINNNGYAGYMYLYDKDGNEYGWNPSSHTYTTTAEIVSFRPTTNDSGRLTTNGLLNDLEENLSNVAIRTGRIENDLGLYHCNIWGGQVNFRTGQLYGVGYNNFHFSDPIPIDDNVKSVFCADPNVDRYMFYSDMPVIGENAGIYLGYKEKIKPDPIPSGTKYAIVVFAEQYVPSVQPFDVFVDKIAYSVNFSKKMEGKKLVTIGDSLTQSCLWQPKLMRYSGMQWSFNECYAGVGYVNIHTGEYTTENKSTDPDYRHAYPSALYGTPIRPTSANSIFMRSFDVKFYTPDIIFIYAGENDPINNWKSANNPGTTPDEVVANEIPYKTNAVDASVSAIAAYKGMIENLMEDCPGAVIYIVSSMRVYGEIGKEVEGVVRFQNLDDVKEWEETARFPRVEYMRAIAKYYNLPLIDLWSKSGINDYNASQWYGATAADATQVHPETNGYLRMADVMLQSL